MNQVLPFSYLLGLRKSKKAQVWVETVVYTLIALAIIGVVLAFVEPKIEETKDKSILEQSTQILEEIDSTIQEVSMAQGNKREIGINIKKGSLVIDGKNNTIYFKMDSNYLYSESGKEINKGDVTILTTEKGGKSYEVKIYLNYNKDIQWEGEDIKKTLDKSSEKYSIYISNKGDEINFEQ